eukprot:gene33980-41122_t
MNSGEIVLFFLLTIFLTTQAQQRVWTRMSGTNGADAGNAVAMNTATGDVYVVGSASDTLHGRTHSGSNDIAILKYASNGTRVWTRLEGTAGSDVGHGVVYYSGAIYVTGFAAGNINGETTAGGSDIIVMRFNEDGSRIWTKLLGSPNGDEGRAICVDTNTGGIFVTGLITGSMPGNPYFGSADIIVARYDTSGARDWVRVEGTSGIDLGYSIAVIPSIGGLFVTGTIQGSYDGEAYIGSYDIFVMRFATGDGERQWTRLSGGELSDFGYGVAVDTTTNHVYMAGTLTTGTALFPGTYDIVISRYASNGALSWTRQVGTTGVDVGYSVSVDQATRAIYVAGFASGDLHGETHAGGGDVVLMKYANDGTRQWTRMVGANGDDRGFGVVVDGAAERLYISGHASGNLH